VKRIGSKGVILGIPRNKSHLALVPGDTEEERLPSNAYK